MAELVCRSRFLVGCSGWRESREKYFGHFPVVELQDTFYDPPSAALAQKWRVLAPASFQFCLKAWQLITHPATSPTYRRLKSQLSPDERQFVGFFRPTEQVWLAWERIEILAGILRAPVILFQCPASFTPEPENIRNLRAFFLRIARGPHVLAWEPRGESWSQDLVRELCSELDLLHCVDPFQRESISRHRVYWRLHGRGGYSYRYSDDELDELAQCLRAKADSGGPSFIFFNNVWMKDDAFRFQARMNSGPSGRS